MRVVINRTDAIGDVLLTMPLAKMIKEKFPQAKIVFIVSSRTIDLLKNHPYIDEYWVWMGKKSFFFNLAYLKRRFSEFKPDTYIHVGGSHLPSFYAWFKRIPFRGGLKSKWQTFLFLNKGVRQARSMVTMHESDYNLNLLSPLGLEYSHQERERYKPEINLTLEEVDKALEDFRTDLVEKGMDPGKPMVFIHPGMTGHTLNWSSRNYGRLVSRIEERYPNHFNFIISHTPSDERFMLGLRDYLEQNSESLDKKVYFFNGALKGLRHYMAVLSQAEVFIGPSTGTTHIANALGVKQVAIYSPIKVQSSLRWGPFHRDSGVEVLVPDVVCGETFSCAGEVCPYYECMAKIEVEDVMEAVERVLKTEKL